MSQYTQAGGRRITAREKVFVDRDPNCGTVTLKADPCASRRRI
jgi:hypothetical protein